jgi:hypothetical protein
LKEKYA